MFSPKQEKAFSNLVGAYKKILKDTSDSAAFCDAVEEYLGLFPNTDEAYAAMGKMVEAAYKQGRL